MARLIFHIILAFMLFTELHRFAGAQGIGVSYSRNADNLPPATDAIALCKSHGVRRIRLHDPRHDALRALSNMGIKVILGVGNEDIMKLATDWKFARIWVRINVLRFTPNVSFRCIAVGDDYILANTTLNQYLLPAMISLKEALKSVNLSVPVSTVMHPLVLPTSFPPSAGYFDSSVLPLILPIVQFLQTNRSPLLYPVYSYWVYLSNVNYTDTPLDFALLNTDKVIVQDVGLGYSNILDAQVDAAYSALEKVGASEVEIIVTETGWPSCEGTPIATVANAQTYNNNLIKRLKNNVGTPKRSQRGLESYIFSLFVQDFKKGKNCYGLFYPNMTHVYPLDM